MYLNGYRLELALVGIGLDSDGGGNWCYRMATPCLQYYISVLAAKTGLFITSLTWPASTQGFF